MHLCPLVALCLALSSLLCGCGNYESLEVQPSESSSNSQSAEMPYSSQAYCEMDWTLESLESHFRELGFHDFEEHPVEPDDDDYNRNIYELYHKSLLFDNSWEAGAQLDSDETIIVFYNEQPTWTLESCPDLASALAGTSDYLEFAEKYDGQYVSFDAYVSYQLTTATLDDIIYVARDYSSAQADSVSIRVGNGTHGNTVRGATPVGTKVHLEGRVSKRWSEFYKTLYIEGRTLHSID